MVRYWWKNMLKVLTGEASKDYKKKNQRQKNQTICIICTTEEVSSWPSTSSLYVFFRVCLS